MVMKRTLATPLLVLTLAAASLVRASYPTHHDAGTVHDFADVLTVEQEESIRSVLEPLRREHGVEVAVVTVRSFRDYATDADTFEDFATGLFNDWGIGDADRNDGALLLFARDDRAVRIELGSGYRGARNVAARRIVDDVLVPRFRTEQYGSGLLWGARALAEELTPEPARNAPPLGVNPPQTAARAPTETRPVPIPPPAPPPTPSAGEVAGALGILLSTCLLPFVLLGAAAWGLVALWRWWRRPPRCPHCAADLQLLDERHEDPHLEPGQILEERLGSREHDVYLCPACRNVTVRSKNRFFTTWTGCPQCRYRTLATERETLDSPTKWSEGMERLTTTCRHCDYSDIHFVALPRLVDPPPAPSPSRSNAKPLFSSPSSPSSSDSSSPPRRPAERPGSSSGSSGGSFGGGRSSGDGASGRW